MYVKQADGTVTIAPVMFLKTNDGSFHPVVISPNDNNNVSQNQGNQIQNQPSNSSQPQIIKTSISQSQLGNLNQNNGSSMIKQDFPLLSNVNINQQINLKTQAQAHPPIPHLNNSISFASNMTDRDSVSLTSVSNNQIKNLTIKTEAGLGDDDVFHTHNSCSTQEFSNSGNSTSIGPPPLTPASNHAAEQQLKVQVPIAIQNLNDNSNMPNLHVHTPTLGQTLSDKRVSVAVSGPSVHINSHHQTPVRKRTATSSLTHSLEHTPNNKLIRTSTISGQQLSNQNQTNIEAILNSAIVYNNEEKNHQFSSNSINNPNLNNGIVSTVSSTNMNNIKLNLQDIRQSPNNLPFEILSKAINHVETKNDDQMCQNNRDE